MNAGKEAGVCADGDPGAGGAVARAPVWMRPAQFHQLFAPGIWESARGAFGGPRALVQTGGALSTIALPPGAKSGLADVELTGDGAKRGTGLGEGGEHAQAQLLLRRKSAGHWNPAPQQCATAKAIHAPFSASVFLAKCVRGRLRHAPRTPPALRQKNGKRWPGITRPERVQKSLLQTMK